MKKSLSLQASCSVRLPGTSGVFACIKEEFVGILIC